jgi:hypothetical protein
MADGRIGSDLPEVKRVAVDALRQRYKSERDAKNRIRRSMEEFYRKQYPEVLSGKRAEVERAVKEVQQIYSRNYFPRMRASWKAFQDNLGHMYYLGCFRCHDGKHVSDDGKVLSKDCQVCHTIISQQTGDQKPQSSLSGVAFRHPADIGDVWKETNCSNCHGEE